MKTEAIDEPAFEALRQLPPETDARFLMFVTAAIFLTVHIALMLTTALGLLEPALQAQIASIQLTNETIPPGGSVLDLTLEERLVFAAQQRELALQALYGLWPSFALPVVTLLLFFLVTRTVYVTHPSRILRRYGKNSLALAELPWLAKEFAEVGVQGIQRIHLVARQHGSAIAERVFGRRSAHELLIFGKASLIERLQPAPFLQKMWTLPGFRASVLHELAHVHNGDVYRGYLSLAVWQVFVGLVVVPGSCLLLGLMIWSGAFLALAPLLLRIGVLVAVAWAIWASLLRVREHYADWWATYHLPNGYAYLLHEPEHKAPTSWIRALIHRISRIWSNHPSGSDRRRIIDDPRPLFRVSADLALLAGVAFALVVVGVALIFLSLGMFLSVGSSALTYSLVPAVGLPDGPQGFDPYALIVLLVGVFMPAILTLILGTILPARFVTGVLGAQVLRDGLAHGQSTAIQAYFKLIFSASLFTVGFIAGLLILPFSFFTPVTALNFLIALALALLFCGAIWFWMMYVRLLGTRWLTGSVSEICSGYRTVQRIATPALALLFWIFLPPMIGVLYNEQVVAQLPLEANRDDFVRYYLGGTALFPTFFFFLLFCGYVLLSLFILPKRKHVHRSEAASPPADRARLEPIAKPEPLDTQTPLVISGEERSSDQLQERHSSNTSMLIIAIALGLFALACLLFTPLTLMMALLSNPPVGESLLVQRLWRPVTLLIPLMCCLGSLFFGSVAVIIGRYKR